VANRRPGVVRPHRAPGSRQHDLRSTELGHVADLIREERQGIVRGERSALAARLPGLAGTLDTVARHLIRAGLLMVKQIRLEPRQRAAR
jgi:hypothetical protein